MIKIRKERAADVPTVYQINEAAFGRTGEAALVDNLRRRSAFTLSLVAEFEGQVVGHALFTPVTVAPEGQSTPDRAAHVAGWTAVALGPIAVLPDYQNRGIGTQLIRAGLAACLAQGDDVVFVLGRPHYYPRFGFVPALNYGIKSAYDVPAEVFMMAELRAGALAGRKGVVRYAADFNEV